MRPSVTLRGPPWILKWGGLARSGKTLISSNGKRKLHFFGPILKEMFLTPVPNKIGLTQKVEGGRSWPP